MSENERKSMIRIRGGFSERNRIIHFGDVIQTTEFEYFSRVALCNCMYDFMSNIFEVVCSPSYSLYPEYSSSFEAAFCKDMIRNVFHEHDECSHPDSYSWNSIYTSVRDVITDAPYNEVLDIIEYICNILRHAQGQEIFIKRLMIYSSKNVLATALSLNELSLLRITPK